MALIMAKKSTKKPNEVVISEIPPGKTMEDYPEDTIFIWTRNEEEDRDEDWEDV